MASPPPDSGATSPPGPNPLTLPRQRPSLFLPQAPKSRQPSLNSVTSSAHPLRQTSFPPSDSLEAQHQAAEDAALARYSPDESADGIDDGFSDSEIVSAISGPTSRAGGDDGFAGSGRKRKRGGGRKMGRPRKSEYGRKGSASLVNGDDGGTPTTARGRGAAASVVTDGNADEDDDDNDDEETGGGGRLPLYEGGQMTAAELATDQQQKSLFRTYMDHLDHGTPLSDPSRSGITSRDFGDRYDVWNRAKLRTNDVRRLVNQTLSQSVPANVVTVVSAYTKMFAGLLIEGAREVQGEWMAMEERRADGEENPAWKRVKRAHDGVEQLKAEKEAQRKKEATPIKTERGADGLSSSLTPPVVSADEKKEPPLFPGGAGDLQTSIEECDRGPLLPDHLREALRRYKKSRKGGMVGFTGLSLEGRESAASKMGGRRLFR